MDQERDQGLTFFIDGVAYTAREQPDLSWLEPYGKVFYVFGYFSFRVVCLHQGIERDSECPLALDIQL